MGAGEREVVGVGVSVRECLGASVMVALSMSVRCCVEVVTRQQWVLLMGMMRVRVALSALVVVVVVVVVKVEVMEVSVLPRLLQQELRSL